MNKSSRRVWNETQHIPENRFQRWLSYTVMYRSRGVVQRGWGSRLQTSQGRMFVIGICVFWGNDAFYVLVLGTSRMLPQVSWQTLKVAVVLSHSSICHAGPDWLKLFRVSDRDIWFFFSGLLIGTKTYQRVIGTRVLECEDLKFQQLVFVFQLASGCLSFWWLPFREGYWGPSESLKVYTYIMARDRCGPDQLASSIRNNITDTHRPLAEKARTYCIVFGKPPPVLFYLYCNPAENYLAIVKWTYAKWTHIGL